MLGACMKGLIMQIVLWLELVASFGAFNLPFILMLAGPINFTPERTKQLSSKPQQILEGYNYLHQLVTFSPSPPVIRSV
jgi:hypothetical protein